MKRLKKTIRKTAKRALVPYRQMLRYFQSRMAEKTTYLRSCEGIIHVGANAGQERYYYSRLGLEVLWVEPIPSVYAELVHNIQNFPQQKAIQALLAAKDDESIELQIASNSGKSSSILPPAEHAEIWPDVEFNHTVTLSSLTLGTALERNNIQLNKFDALLLDTQGAELLILQGATRILSHFSFIQVEAANFEAYVNCPRIEDIIAFVEPHGFTVDPASLNGSDTGERKHIELLFKNNRLGPAKMTRA